MPKILVPSVLAPLCTNQPSTYLFTFDTNSQSVHLAKQTKSSYKVSTRGYIYASTHYAIYTYTQKVYQECRGNYTYTLLNFSHTYVVFAFICKLIRLNVRTNYDLFDQLNWYYANISNDKSVMIFEVVMNETDISSKNSQSILHNDSLYLQVFCS